MKITIVIPTYNEAESLKQTLLDLEAVVAKELSHEVTILIFDSHSTDQTVEVVQAMQQEFANIHLLCESQKSGLGSAYLQAMAYAWGTLQAELIFEFDADGSHQPQFILPMIEAIEQGHDVALGSRYVKGGRVQVGWPWYRRLISQGGNYVARVFLTPRYKDFTSGFRATRAEFLQRALAEGLLSKNYAYKIHLLWRLHQLQAKILEVPIIFIDREAGYSKFPKNNILESLKVVLILRLQAWAKKCSSI